MFSILDIQDADDGDYPADEEGEGEDDEYRHRDRLLDDFQLKAGECAETQPVDGQIPAQIYGPRRLGGWLVAHGPNRIRR